jgi:Holliday junction resolvasome RuvABC DNA-binding subunit
MVGHIASNLVTFCEAHHLAHHTGALKIDGDAESAVFTRTHASNYKNATFAVDTAKALRGLGFKPDEIKHAVAQTRTHVGTADLTLQQWITIALRYCPKPNGSYCTTTQPP